MTNSLNGINATKLAAISKTVAKGGQTLSVADAGTVQAFLDDWLARLAVYARALRAAGKVLDAPVVVVYVPDMASFSLRPSWRRRSTIGATPHESLAGCMIASSTRVGGFLFNSNLASAAEFEAALEAEQLAASPTIMLATSDSALIWVDGVTGLTNPVERTFLDDGLLVNAPAIDFQLQRFYELVARQCMKWWKDPDKLITYDYPERRVQGDLWNFLISQFGGDARVKSEEPIGNGRADITIWPLKPTAGSAPNESVVLELKTIRDFRTPKRLEGEPLKISAKTNARWAAAGARQAASYRDRERMDAAYLCVYDFRKNDCIKIDAEISPTCTQYKITPRRYWISSSHSAFIDKNYPEVPKNT